MPQINTNIGNMQLVINLVPDIIYRIQSAENRKLTGLQIDTSCKSESSYICLVI